MWFLAYFVIICTMYIICLFEKRVSSKAGKRYYLYQNERVKCAHQAIYICKWTLDFGLWTDVIPVQVARIPSLFYSHCVCYIPRSSSFLMKQALCQVIKHDWTLSFSLHARHTCFWIIFVAQPVCVYSRSMALPQYFNAFKLALFPM